MPTKNKGTKSRIEEILIGLDDTFSVFGPPDGSNQQFALIEVGLLIAERMACKWFVSGYYRVPAAKEYECTRLIREKTNEIRRRYGIGEIPYPSENADST